MEVDVKLSETQAADDELPAEVKERILQIKFTNTAGQLLAEARETVEKDRKELEQQYLEYMATTYANELDALRKKPDFNDKLIALLAKTLQSGSNLFDDETLSILTKSN